MISSESINGPSSIKLSQAIELGFMLEPPGSALSFKGCAIGLAMGAVGVPRNERTGRKARELWPWLGERTGKSFFGLLTVEKMREINDWYFNVRLGRMTMTTLLGRIRAMEAMAAPKASEAVEAEYLSSQSSI